MVSGVPKSGKRTPYKRWTVEQLYGLYRRWHAGETLQELASSVGSTRGRLRWAMDYHGLKAPRTLARPKNRDASKPEPTSRQHYNPSTNYNDRHYKGSFDL